MKTGIQSSPLVVSGFNPNDVSVMGMDAAGMAASAQAFRDSIYTEEVWAVVREWASNAADEHGKHKINRPIELTIKDGRFHVRDFALGMDDHTTRYIFGSYFKSTKSDSNSEIGGFGVGAKAGHCYQETFYVRSCHNGIERSYVCSLGADEHGNSLGQMIKVNEQPTTETGVEVSIDIKDGEAHLFIDKMKRFAAFCPQPVKIVVDDLEVPVAKRTFFREKNGIKLFISEHPSEKLVVSMGGVPYKHTFNPLTAWSNRLNSDVSTLQIDVPIGSLLIPISRESFKDAPRNREMFAQIEQFLGEVFEEETAKIKALAYKDIAVKFFGKTFISSDGLFKIPQSALMSDGSIVSFVTHGEKFGESYGNPQLKKNKPLVVLLSPMQGHREKQLDKLSDFIDQNQQMVLGGSMKIWKDLNDAQRDQIREVFSVATVASLFPSQPRSKDKFAVYTHDFRRKNGDYTPLDFHNKIWKTQHTTIEEAQDHLELQKEEATITCDILTQLKINRQGDGFAIGRRAFRAKALWDCMRDLGYLISTDKDYQDLAKVLQDREEEKRRKQTLRSEAQTIASKFCSAKTKAMVANLTERQMTRLITHKKAVFSNFKPAQATVFKLIENSYSSVPRDQIRTFLKLGA